VSFRIGYTEAISDCMVSLRKCEKLMPASTM